MTDDDKKIPLSQPDINEDDIEAVARCLRSGRLSRGPWVEEFEAGLAEFIGTKHAIAVSSGTAALHILMVGLGLRPGDEVITTPFSFIASTNCILYAGARPVFVDIDPHSLNLDPRLLDCALTDRTKMILPVHVFGRPCAMDALMSFADQHILDVVEDACEAIGSRYRSQSVGSFGIAAALAFYPNKQITTGEGGAIVTNDPFLAELCRALRNQARAESGASSHYSRLGFNYRITDLQCALGISQLRRIRQLVARRSEVAGWYRELLADVKEIILPVPPEEGAEISWCLFVIRLGDQFGEGDRDLLLERMAENGIECHAYFPVIHREAFIRKELGPIPGSFPVAEAVAARTVALPFSSVMSREQVERVCNALKASLVRRASRRC